MIAEFLGAQPVYDDTNFIASTASVIGDVRLGSDSSVWLNATVRGDVNWIRIGKCTNIQDNAVVHVTNRTAPTSIGDFVTIAHGAVVHGCTIRDRVLIGIGAVILDGAEIGSDSIVGASALVTSGTRIPARSLVLGSPARVIRELTKEEVAGIRANADNYVQYSRIYRGVDRPDHNPYYNRIEETD
ncbi:MAG: gamma carbonic anhydrase family protein [Rhodothermales bacterium]|nr:gamma carbonic anhydrase family protein [Rhodothermales bacterium]